MTLQGGPCTVMRKRRGQSAVGVCGDTISGAWYAGPTCKACYERGVRAKNRAKKQKRNRDRGRRGRHDRRHCAESAQDKRLSVRALELAPQGPGRTELTVDRIPRRCRFSLIPSTLGDRSNPPPDSDDSDDDLEYDIYGWFNFETDAEGVKRLDRKWVPLAAAAVEPLRPRTSATPWRRTRRGSRRRRRTMSEWCPAVLFTGPRRRQM